MDWFVALAVALAQVRKELAGFGLLLAMSGGSDKPAPWGFDQNWLKLPKLVLEVRSMAPILSLPLAPASRA